MRVLVVALREPWPLNSGGRLHLYHVLKQLSRQAEVTLALPAPAKHPDCLPRDISVETITPTAEPRRREATDRRRTCLVGRLARRHFRHERTLEAWLRRRARPERFDVVLLNGAVLGQHAPVCRVPVVWNPQDELVLPTIRAAQHESWRHWPAALRRAALYALYERHVASHAAATIFVSTVDAAYARRWVGQARLEVVQNGVDCDYFRPGAAPPVPGTVAFVGSLEFPPNVDGIVRFATRIWPGVHARDARRRLLVVGRRPVAAVRALTALPGVEVAADVPDVRPYLSRAAAVVVPTRKGGGLKNKLLEACAMKRAVVASPRALGGLSARIGVDVLAADTPQRWTAQVCRLLEQPARAQAIAQNGYNWVRRAHHWSVTGRRFAEILASVQRAPAGSVPRNGATEREAVGHRRFAAVIESPSAVS